MKFLIVTPSRNGLDDVKRCIASVRDQVAPETQKSEAGGQASETRISDLRSPISELQVHHHIQDAGSSDGTAEFLQKYSDQHPDSENYRFTFSSEKDAGLYDAVAKGWKRYGCEADVVAWLNCDEQYLPESLQAVGRFFSERPAVDVLFGDVLVIRPDGSLLCARRAVLPEHRHMLTSYLTVFSAAMFLRANAVKERSLYPDLQWRILGDVDLIDRMLCSGIRFGLLRRFLASFTDSGENISLTSGQVGIERELLVARLSPAEAALKPLWVLRHRIQKLLTGAYRPFPVSYAVYTDSLSQRTPFSETAARAVWKGRL